MSKYRIDQVVTKKGDKGKTTLGDGSQVDKDHPRTEAYSTLDELNSCIGVIRAHYKGELDPMFERLQKECFDAGSELAVPGFTQITDEYIKRLELDIGVINQDLEPLKEFILPGGSKAAAFCHQARTICRRAERRVVTVMREAELNPNLLIYLNRLSDLLFVTARALNQAEGIQDTLWRE